jgi:flagellar biosynthesis GTPase FlhF
MGRQKKSEAKQALKTVKNRTAAEITRKAAIEAQELRDVEERLRRPAEKTGSAEKKDAAESAARDLEEKRATEKKAAEKKAKEEKAARELEEKRAAERKAAEKRAAQEASQREAAAKKAAVEKAAMEAAERARREAATREHIEARARLIHDAIAGLGTDEDELIRVICHTSVSERQQLKDAYSSMYKADLVDKVRGDTSGDFQKALLCMLNATEKPFDLEADCQAMYEAMHGWGTDETALVELICGKTRAQMHLVNEKFKELHNRELYDFVRSETSGHFQAVMLGWIGIPR